MLDARPVCHRHHSIEGQAQAYWKPPQATQGVDTRSVCVDQRVVLWTRGTGASEYASGLRRGVRAAGFTLSALTDSADPDDVPPGRAWRWMAAASPWPVQANPIPGGMLARDVFRRAQVHFDAYGRYLRLRTPSPPALMHWSYPLPLHLAGVPNLYSVLDPDSAAAAGSDADPAAAQPPHASPAAT